MVKLSFILICFCISITAISNAAYAQEGVSLSGLPAVVQEVVKREFARVRVTQIDEGEYDGILVYEIEAETADGRELQIEVGKDGTLYQKDEEIRLQDLPSAVLVAVKKELGNVEPDDLKRITEQGKVNYYVKARVSGKEVKLKIGVDGTPLDKEVEGGDDDNAWVYPAHEFPVGDIDLSKAEIVALNPGSKIQANAADMLRDEIEKRTRIGLEVVTSMPAKEVPAIVLGVGKEVTEKYPLPEGLELPNKADGYTLWIETDKRDARTVCLAGVDERGGCLAKYLK